jgi:hypothetical protein
MIYSWSDVLRAIMGKWRIIVTDFFKTGMELIKN